MAKSAKCYLTERRGQLGELWESVNRCRGSLLLAVVTVNCVLEADNVIPAVGGDSRYLGF